MASHPLFHSKSPGGSGDSFGTLLRRDLLETERQKGLLIGWIHVPIALLAFLMQLRGNVDFPNLANPAHRFLIPAGIGTIALYGFALSRYARRLLREGKFMPTGVSYLTAFIELTLPSMMMLILLFVGGRVDALVGPPSFVYTLFIVLLAVRLNPTLAVVGGFVAAVEFGLIAATFKPTVVDEIGAKLFGTAGLLMRPIVFLSLGVVTGWIARELRKRIHHAVGLVQDQERVVNIFGRYVSPGVAEVLIHAPEGLQMGGAKRNVTMLMSDLRGFSVLSDQLDPHAVIKILNYYLAVMTEVITAHLGIIDEIIGDGIFVVFGAPIERPDDADRAVACALAMQEAMELVNAWQRAHGYPDLEMGIAVNTGEVIVGNIGSEQRSKYGVVGSQVNLTSRIESFTVGDQILVSQMTRAAMKAELECDGEITIHPKGTSEPLQVFSARGIGAPFNVRIPERSEPLHQVIAPIGVRFQVMEGTATSPEASEGRIVRLSSRGAELETSAEIDLHADLRLVLLSSDGSVLGDRLFAKVTHARPGILRLRFTAKGAKEERLLAEGLTA